MNNAPSAIVSIPVGWSKAHDGKAIKKTFVFDDFEAAFDFMARCKEVIDALNHHPEWLNIYNKVFVTLTTHDTDSVSDLDIELAQNMDQLFKASKT